MQKNNQTQWGYYQLVAYQQGEKLVLSKSLLEELILEERCRLSRHFRDAMQDECTQLQASHAYERFGDFLWEQKAYAKAWESYRKGLYFSIGVPHRKSKALNWRFAELDRKVGERLRSRPELDRLYRKDETLCYARQR